MLGSNYNDILKYPLSGDKVESFHTVKVLNKLADALRCSVCKEIAEKPFNVGGGCCHFFCHQCLLGLAESVCPTCGWQFYPSDLAPDTTISSILQEWNTISAIVNRAQSNVSKKSLDLSSTSKNKELKKSKAIGRNNNEYSSNAVADEITERVNDGCLIRVHADVHKEDVKSQEPKVKRSFNSDLAAGEKGKSERVANKTLRRSAGSGNSNKSDKDKITDGGQITPPNIGNRNDKPKANTNVFVLKRSRKRTEIDKCNDDLEIDKEDEIQSKQVQQRNRLYSSTPKCLTKQRRNADFIGSESEKTLGEDAFSAIQNEDDDVFERKSPSKTLADRGQHTSPVKRKMGRKKLVNNGTLDEYNEDCISDTPDRKLQVKSNFYKEKHENISPAQVNIRKDNKLFPEETFKVTPSTKHYPRILNRESSKPTTPLQVNTSTDDDDFIGFTNNVFAKENLASKVFGGSKKGEAGLVELYPKRKSSEMDDEDDRSKRAKEKSKKAKVISTGQERMFTNGGKPMDVQNGVPRSSSRSNMTDIEKAKKSKRKISQEEGDKKSCKGKSLTNDENENVYQVGNSQFGSQGSSEIIPATPQDHGTDSIDNKISIIEKRRKSKKQESEANGPMCTSLNSSGLGDISFYLKKKDTVKVNKKGETPLQVACAKGNFKVVKALLANGSNPNTRDYAGWTPLHEAVQKGSRQIVEALVEAGASVNTPGMYNITPLLEAVTKDNVDLARFLLLAGADVNIRSQYDIRPLDYAKSEEMIKLLTKPPSADKKVESPKSNFCMPEPFLLCAVDLNGSKMMLLHQFCCKFNLRYVTALRPEVTHMIVETEDNLCKANTTILRAIASGIAVISFNWIELDLKSDGPPVPDAWEVHGTVCYPNSEAPMRSRINAQRLLPKLFDGLHIYLDSYGYPWKNLNRSDALDIIRDAGAKALTREPDPEAIPESEATVMFHADPDGPMGVCSHVILYVPGPKEPQLKYNMKHVKTLSIKWMMDCLQTFSIVGPV